MNKNEVFDNEVVKGVKYNDRQSVVRSLQPGDRLLLRHEPENPHNPNAIRVDTVDGRQVGYLRDELANLLVSRVDSYGAPIPAQVQAITGGPPIRELYGVRMRFELHIDTEPVQSAFNSTYLGYTNHELTDEQWSIVRHPLNEHARVMAVAGSGKTTTMVYRIKHLVENCRIQPSSICVLMFNARARDQFKVKLNEIIENLELQPRNVHTFHSFSYSVIKTASKSGLNISEDEEWIEDKEELSYLWMRRAIDRLVERAVIVKDSISAEDALNCVGLWKGALIPPQRAGHRTEPAMRRVYEEYERLRRDANAITYDDYVPEAIRILEGESEAARGYHNRFRIVIVDEYQDVNYGQQRLVELLVGSHADLMVVGDDDQTIYEWRGARPDYLARHFSSVFSSRPTRPYELTNTFRFGPVLAQCAHNVIVNNSTRVPKSLVAYNIHQNTEVTVVEDASEQPTDADKRLANTVNILIEQGADPKQIVVLGRLYSQFADLETEFLTQKIPYRVHGRKPFLERKEITALLAYLRLAVNYHESITNESLAWLELAANRPNRRITSNVYTSVGESMPSATVAQVMTAVAEDQWASSLDMQQRKQSAEFQRIVNGLCERMNSEGMVPAGKLLRWLVTTTSYMQHYDNFYGVGLNSEERKDAVSTFVRFAEQSGQAASDFLRFIEKLNPSQGKPLEKQVMMTTIFKVKGEEFDYVIMPGCTEGKTPCAYFTPNPTFDEAGLVREPPPSIHIENERRLFYVGVTRARKCVLLGTSVAPRLGQQHAAHIKLPSRFLEEMQHDVAR